MTHGFIITLASGSYPGAKCFVAQSHGSWCRYLEREMAYVFKTAKDAQDAITEIVAEIRYEAPELNLDLAERFQKAQIVPA
jgi:hypothetical protein